MRVFVQSHATLRKPGGPRPEDKRRAPPPGWGIELPHNSPLQAGEAPMGRGSSATPHPQSPWPGLVQDKFKVPAPDTPHPPTGIISRRDWLEAKRGPPGHLLTEGIGLLGTLWVALQVGRLRPRARPPAPGHTDSARARSSTGFSGPYSSQSACFKWERADGRQERQPWWKGSRGTGWSEREKAGVPPPYS